MPHRPTETSCCEPLSNTARQAAFEGKLRAEPPPLDVPGQLPNPPLSLSSPPLQRLGYAAPACCPYLPVNDTAKWGTWRDCLW